MNAMRIVGVLLLVLGLAGFLTGLEHCETPWLLDINAPLRQQASSQWPQAGGSLGQVFDETTTHDDDQQHRTHGTQGQQDFAG